MKRITAVAAIGLLAATTAVAQKTRPLIVVEDLGGKSALPYYQSLNPQPLAGPPPGQPAGLTGPAAGNPEAAMLPARSKALTPGKVSHRPMNMPGMKPLILVGDDDQSRAWLLRRRAALERLGAVGLVVNVESIAALAELRALAPGMLLSPASGDDIAARLGLRHYPVLITPTGIEQ